MLESSAADRSAGSADPEMGYQGVEPWAVGGLMLGLVSPLALLAPLLWVVPILGIAVCALALRRLKLDASRVGRGAALVGLALSIALAIAPLARYGTAFVVLSRQARPVADQWFEYLRENQPEKALMLRTAPDYRPPLNDELWIIYRRDNQASRDLRKFVSEPLVRTLLALGDRAQARLYRTVGVETNGSRAELAYTYTVTFTDSDQKKKTFFVHVFMERNRTEKSGVNPWTVQACMAGADANSLPTGSPT